MSKDVRISESQLRQATREDYDAMINEVTRSVNNAKAGRVIADSEELVRDAMARFRQRVYERAIQLRSEAAEAAFPPSEESGR